MARLILMAADFIVRHLKTGRIVDAVADYLDRRYPEPGNGGGIVYRVSNRGKDFGCDYCDKYGPGVWQDCFAPDAMGWPTWVMSHCMRCRV